MSDGDGKESVKFLSQRDSQQSEGKRKLESDEFAQSIARIAVAQVCESAGFQSFQQSALDILADVGVRYIREIGKTARLHSNLANRSQCNVFDVIQGLEDLGSIQGFSGASDVRHPFSGSGIVRDIIRYVGKAEEIPFAYSLPVFPVVKKRTLDPSFAQADENPPDGHIPSWLPKFPDPESYADITLAEDDDKDKDPEAVVLNKVQRVEEEHRKVEIPLQNMQQNLLHNGYERVAVANEDGAQAQRAAESNPFLVPPLQFGEKAVSLPVLPAKLLEEDAVYPRNNEVMETNLLTLKPSLKTNEMRRTHHCEPEDGRQLVLNGRPSVHFQIGNGKKHSGTVTSSRNAGIKKLSPWFDGNDDDDVGGDGNDEESRAEKLCFENAAHPPRTTHL